MQYYFFHKPNNQRLSVDSCARWKQKCEFYQELFNNYFTCHTLFFLQATSLCVQGQKLLNHYHNFYAKSCLAVAQEIFNEYSIVAFIPLNEGRNLTKTGAHLGVGRGEYSPALIFDWNFVPYSYLKCPICCPILT